MKQHVLHINSIAELLHADGTHVTGFSLRTFKKGRISEDAQSQHNYILYIIGGGKLEMSCSLYQHKIVKAGDMVFLPRGTAYRIESLESNSRILFFAFDTTFVKMNESLYNYFVNHASDTPYSFNTLPINEHMAKAIELIVMQMTSHKRIVMTEICQAWNTIIFTTLATFYQRKDLLNFLRPIMSSKISFRSFVENNYLDAQGKVSKLVELSGMPMTTFNYYFKKEFGCAPKLWFHEQLKRKITALVTSGNVRPTDIAKALHINVRRLSQITQKHFGHTPSELIRQIVTQGQIVEAPGYETTPEDEN